jgi:hypothetical protein
MQFRAKITGTVTYSDSVDNSVTIVDQIGQTFAPTYGDTSAEPSFASAEMKLNADDVALGFVTVEVPNAGSTPAQVRFGTGSGSARPESEGRPVTDQCVSRVTVADEVKATTGPTVLGVGATFVGELAFGRQPCDAAGSDGMEAVVAEREHLWL